jgi:hypothetical protein
MKHIEEGQRVQVRSWDDMEAEFGLDPMGDIKCKGDFVEEMSHLCGRTATWKDDEPVFDDDSGGVNWAFSPDMFEPAEWKPKYNEIIHVKDSKGEPFRERRFIAMDGPFFICSDSNVPSLAGSSATTTAWKIAAPISSKPIPAEIKEIIEEQK